MTPPSTANPLTHLRRAFAWDLGRVVPSADEAGRLAAAGVTEPTARRYAAWRRSLLLVAAAVSSVAFALAAADVITGGWGEYTAVGVGLEVAWLAASAALPLSAGYGAVRWTRPGTGTGLLTGAWAAALFLPFIYALLPVGLIYHVEPVTPRAAANPSSVRATAAELLADGDAGELAHALATPANVEKAVAVQEAAVEFVLSGGGYLLLLPAVLSLIPGAVNGCLRVKTLLPAARLPGWLMVTIAPAFLLFWLVPLVLANHAARDPLLVFGVILWAGSPVLYSAFGGVFVRPLLSAADAAKIGRVKRAVGLTGLVGIGLLAAFALTSKVAGLRVVGFDREAAVSTKLDTLAEDDALSLGDVQAAVAESNSIVYAFDLASFRLVVDLLAKLLIVTAVSSGWVLRGTLAAWRIDRGLPTGGDAGYDTDAAALAAALGQTASSPV